MKNQPITKEQAKDTGLAVVLILLLVLYFKNHDYYTLAAIVFLVITMTWPIFFRPAAYIWLGFSHKLGSVVSKILLTLVFFLIVTPIGLFRKMLKADPMKTRQWHKSNESVMINREHLYAKDDLLNPY
jgi:hypothetical protein